MPSTSQRKIILDWFHKSQEQIVEDPDYFARFVFLWISFNSWYDRFRQEIANSRNVRPHQVQEISVIDCLGEYPEFISRYTELMKQPEFLALINELKQKAPINNLLREEEVNFSNANSFHQYLRLIYSIRNNLFHGGKNIDDPRDLSLVSLAYKTLNPVFKPQIDHL